MRVHSTSAVYIDGDGSSQNYGWKMINGSITTGSTGTETLITFTIGSGNPYMNYVCFMWWVGMQGSNNPQIRMNGWSGYTNTSGATGQNSTWYDFYNQGSAGLSYNVNYAYATRVMRWDASISLAGTKSLTMFVHCNRWDYVTIS